MIVFDENTKPQRVNFLFISESKARELETICLIGAELEKRGYTVGVLSWWLGNGKDDFEPIEADVLISHAVYKDKSLNRELSYVRGRTRVLNMQCEQIYAQKDLVNPKSPWKMEGRTNEIMHVSWGEANYRKLVNEDGIPKELVRIVGNPILDTLRPPLNRIYKSREEICREYSLKPDKRICLFISSFSCVDIPDSIKEPELIGIYQVSIDSQKMMFDWFDRLMSKRDDISFIYRMHPAEKDNKALRELEDKYLNFRVISDYTVKQWIMVSDVIYNWYSSSLAEIYFAGKSCFILRPVDMPAEYDCTIFDNGHFITEYDEFEKTVDMEDCPWPVPIENITDNYYVDENEFTYSKIATLAEEVLHSDMKYQEYIPTGEDIKRKKLVRFKRTTAGKILLGLKHAVVDKFIRSEADDQNRAYKEYVDEMRDNNRITDHEVREMLDKIEGALGMRKN